MWYYDHVLLYLYKIHITCSVSLRYPNVTRQIHENFSQYGRIPGDECTGNYGNSLFQIDLQYNVCDWIAFCTMTGNTSGLPSSSSCVSLGSGYRCPPSS